MDKIVTVLKIVVPIFAALFLGVFAKKKQMMTMEENRGLQKFVTNFGLPCILFNSCFNASIGAESLTSMALLLPLVFLSSLWAFKIGKKKYPYHNMPFLFSAQESGMLGIPLYMTLFGAAAAYRMGVLDLTQNFVAIPVIALLTSDTGENPKISDILKNVFRSPFLIMSLLGLFLNFSGIGAVLNQIGIGGVITETTGFIAQPVSAAILFSVGYNFSLGEGNRKAIFGLCGIHFGMFFLFGLLMQAAMCLLPSVDPQTRWAVLMYTTLPGSFLTPGFGKTEEEQTVLSGVCSILTVVTLIIFCIVAVVVA